MTQIALSEEQLRRGRDEVIQLQGRIRRIIEQIKEIEANATQRDQAASEQPRLV